MEALKFKLRSGVASLAIAACVAVGGSIASAPANAAFISSSTVVPFSFVDDSFSAEGKLDLYTDFENMSPLALTIQLEGSEHSTGSINFAMLFDNFTSPWSALTLTLADASFTAVNYNDYEDGTGTDSGPGSSVTLSYSPELDFGGELGLASFGPDGDDWIIDVSGAHWDTGLSAWTFGLSQFRRNERPFFIAAIAGVPFVRLGLLGDPTISSFTHSSSQNQVDFR